MREMGIVPPGGFRFFQRLPNGSMQLFVGTDKDDLVRQITTFRVNNNIDVGDVRAEVDKGISGASHKIPGDQRSLRERVTGWKSNRAFTKLEFVDETESQRRAAICVDCPRNKLKYYTDCIECHQGTARDLYAMRQGRSTDNDIWLGACEVAGHDNVTAVHLDEKNLRHRVTYMKELPDNCWMKHLDDADKT